MQCALSRVLKDSCSLEQTRPSARLSQTMRRTSWHSCSEVPGTSKNYRSAIAAVDGNFSISDPRTTLRACIPTSSLKSTDGVHSGCMSTIFSRVTKKEPDMWQPMLNPEGHMSSYFQAGVVSLIELEGCIPSCHSHG